MPIIRTLILSIIVLQTLIYGFEYCKNEVKLCGQKDTHIMCNKEQIQPATKYKKHIPMSHKVIDSFIYWHNYHRNEVACGKVAGSDGDLPTAKQMRELVWDFELEHLAYVHAGRCAVKHDKCRNTERIPISGQNLYSATSFKKTIDPSDVAHSALQVWFGEHTNCPVEIIGLMTIGLPVGHFTAISHDMVGRVGCAISIGTAGELIYIYVTCNYDYSNVLGQPIYHVGKPASNCDIYGDYGTSSNFSCLCAKTYKKYNASTLW